jgi:hypothetical protein
MHQSGKLMQIGFLDAFPVFEAKKAPPFNGAAKVGKLVGMGKSVTGY